MRARTFASFTAITLFVTPAITAQTFAQNIGSSSASETKSKPEAEILDHYGKLPLSFEANHGQMEWIRE